MAHNIEELDNVMLGSNTPAWHDLGTVVAGQPNSAEALKLAGLDWNTTLEPLTLPDGQGGMIEIPNAFATIRDDLPRTDTRRVLGTVTSRYEPISNVEAFSIVDEFAGEGGARYETAGSLRNGRIAWMMAAMPNTTTVVDDTLKQYLLLSTSHDGTRSVQINFTPVRVVCWNTLSLAVNTAQRSAFIRHTKNKSDQIVEAKRILGLAGEYFENHGQTMTRLAKSSIDDRFAAAFVMTMFPDPEPGQRWSLADKKRSRVLQLYKGEQAGADQQATKGTAYGLYNALAEYADHEKTVMAMGGRTRSDARMDSVMFGSSATLKQQAAGLLTRVLELEKEPDQEPAARSDVEALLSQFQLEDDGRKASIDALLDSIDFDSN